jgi:hypothetical protein
LSATLLGLGFHVGRERATRLVPPPIDEQQTNRDDVDDSEGILDGDLALIQAGFNEQCKLVMRHFASMPWLTKVQILPRCWWLGLI